MKLTNDVAKRCGDMVNNFAKRNGLIVYARHDFDKNRTELEFWNPKYIIPEHYHILWGDIDTMSEACAAVYADLMIKWKFGSVNVGLCEEKSGSDTVAYDAFEIKDVIFNDPATIILWEDGTKTVVKVQDGDEWSAEHGFAMAIAKKALGNKGNFNEVFKKWLPVESVYPSVLISDPVSHCTMREEFHKLLHERIEAILKDFHKKGPETV